MTPWPTVLVSTVRRGAQAGDGHGGLHVVDLEFDEHRSLLEWRDPEIDFSGRGGDRGLRGVEIVGDRVFVAASRAILELDSVGGIRRLVRCPWLHNAHEVSFRAGYLFVASTGADAILGLNVATMRFDWGLHLRVDDQNTLVPQAIDPQANPPAGTTDRLHLNQVCAVDGGLQIAGLRLGVLLELRDGDLHQLAILPAGTHNARSRPDRSLLYNDTRRDQLVHDPVAPAPRVALAAPRPHPASLAGAIGADPKLARAGFARGLIDWGPTRVIGGVSPAAVVAYDLAAGRIDRSVSLTDDVRIAVHGLCVWPFDG